MSEQTRRNVDFPKEWEFKQMIENADRYLEARIANTDYIPKNPDLKTPFNMIGVINEMINKLTPKNEMENLFGTMYVILKNKWYLNYRPIAEQREVLSPPKERVA